MIAIMSGNDFAEARARMNAVREEIYRAVEGRGDDELLAPPADSGWSAAEVLDHLRRAEGGLVRGLEAQKRGEPLKIPRRRSPSRRSGSGRPSRSSPAPARS